MQLPSHTYASRDYVNRRILHDKCDIKMNFDVALFLVSNEGMCMPNYKHEIPVKQQ